MASERNRAESFGCWMSEKVAGIAAHPFAQVAVLAICAAWLLAGFPVDVLTAALSILAITLSQMVLNRQEVREKDEHRRDVALHAKLDELLLASRRARDELAGIEELEEEQIQSLKRTAKVVPLTASKKRQKPAAKGFRTERMSAIGERQILSARR